MLEREKKIKKYPSASAEATEEFKNSVLSEELSKAMKEIRKVALQTATVQTHLDVAGP